MTVIRTISGQDIDLALPRPSAIRIRDIAHHLALLNRFCGATALPYSVCQHSTVVARITEQVSDDPLLALQGLLHDAPEYATGDITTPLQQALGDGLENFKMVENTLFTTIHLGLGVPVPSAEGWNTIKFADRKAFATEWRDLLTGQIPKGYPDPANFPVKPVPWHKAEELFLKEWTRLSLLAGIRPPKIPNLPTGISK